MEDLASLSPVGLLSDIPLAEKAQKVRYALAQMNAFALSQSLVRDELWGNRIGNSDEMNAAERILQQSVKSACKTLQQTELAEAQRLSLLTPAEAAQIKVVNAKDKLRSHTQQQTHGKDNQKY